MPNKVFVFLLFVYITIAFFSGPVRRQLNIHSHFPGCNDTFIDSHHQMPDEGTINCIEPPEFGHSKLRVKFSVQRFFYNVPQVLLSN